MKMNVEVDCTPEEARRFLGLPDLAPIHEKYIANLTQTMEKGLTPEAMETLMKAWTPMGESGLRLWQQLFDTMSGAKR
ncbi:hypothetical protein FHS96_001963 [Sphingomonas zeicaulis]|uniref:DUF6489 family protein n=1 Tax=Sphingomonas zeicaulis TaxID=1632740 RepID=UPI003D20F339